MTTQESTPTLSKAPLQKGVVVSVAMHKTIVVVVDTLKAHSKYKKRYISSKKYKVHDEAGTATVGQVVEFRECRPKSRDKRHEIVIHQG